MWSFDLNDECIVTVTPPNKFGNVTIIDIYNYLDGETQVFTLEEFELLVSNTYGILYKNKLLPNKREV